MEAKVYKMNDIQQRRENFRVTIRRNDLDRRMNLKRTQLTDDFQSACCKDFINQVCSADPSSLFIQLANTLATCPPPVRRSWSLVSWEMLTSLNFSHWKAGIEGLPSLLLTIFGQLKEECSHRLSNPFLIEVLFLEMERTVIGDTWRYEQLYTTAFQLSIYASKQSKFNINFSEEKVENIIVKAHSNRTDPNLRLLTLLLFNLDDDFLRKSLINKIKQIGRWISGTPQAIQDQLLILRFQALMGIYYHFDQSEINAVNDLLDPNSQLDFSLALRFLSEQSKEDWMTFAHAEKFLLMCQSKMEGFQEVKCFLASIQQLCRNEGYQQDTLQTVYKTFFEGKLHHFISSFTIKEITDLILAFFVRKQSFMTDELVKSAMKIIKTGPSGLRNLTNEDVRLLCNHLLSNGAISESEMCEYIGQDNFIEFWDEYIANTNDDC